MEGPYIEWGSDGTAEFLGRWQVKADVIRSGKIERAAYWIDDMPDWARRAQNSIGGSMDVVRWGKHGMDQIAKDVRRILAKAVTLGFIAETRDGWAITTMPMPAVDLAVG